MTEAASGVNQADYMKLFMQELTYQDPLKPVDNREFMAQMAQFSALQQAQMSNDTLEQILTMASDNLTLTLLGKLVKINGSDELGTVAGIKFESEKPPKLTIKMKGSSLLKELGDITEVHQ